MRIYVLCEVGVLRIVFIERACDIEISLDDLAHNKPNDWFTV